MDRPSWDDFYLGLAYFISRRSPDSQTKHGCVLVNDNHQILSVGFNGWPRGMKDELVPNTRPQKYTYVVHAELNALLNCQLPPKGATAYVTGECCVECLKAMRQSGIWRIVQNNCYGSVKITDEDRRVKKEIEEQTHMLIETKQANLNWVTEAFFEHPQLKDMVRNTEWECLAKPPDEAKYVCTTITAIKQMIADAQTNYKRQLQVGLTGGYWTILHSGHVDLIKAARVACDFLVAAVQPDAAQKRKHGFVLMPATHIAAVVVGLGADSAILWEDTAQLIRELKAHMYFKSGEYRCDDDMNAEEVKACHTVGTRIVYGVGGTQKTGSSSEFLRNAANYYGPKLYETDPFKIPYSLGGE